MCLTRATRTKRSPPADDISAAVETPGASAQSRQQLSYQVTYSCASPEEDAPGKVTDFVIVFRSWRAAQCATARGQQSRNSRSAAPRIRLNDGRPAGLAPASLVRSVRIVELTRDHKHKHDSRQKHSG